MKHLYVIAHPEAVPHVRGLVGGWFVSELTGLRNRQADLIGRRIRHLVLRARMWSCTRRS